MNRHVGRGTQFPVVFLKIKICNSKPNFRCSVDFKLTGFYRISLFQPGKQCEVSTTIPEFCCSAELRLERRPATMAVLVAAGLVPAVALLPAGSSSTAAFRRSRSVVSVDRMPWRLLRTANKSLYTIEQTWIHQWWQFSASMGRRLRRLCRLSSKQHP